MGFSITFYNYSGDKNKINKQLSSGTAFSCMPYDSVDIMNPSVILDYNSALESVNYAEFDSKYYFIDSIERMTGGKMMIRLHVDVLKTYAAQILALPAIADRTESESAQNAYLPDMLTRKYAYTRNISALGGSFSYNGDNMILVTVG